MITWIVFKSYPYAENLSPIDPSFNDILTKMSLNFLLEKRPQENKKNQKRLGASESAFKTTRPILESAKSTTEI